MVIFNKEILVCKITMINSIKNIMEQVTEKYFEDEILCKNNENKKKLMKNIIKEKSKEIKTNLFGILIVVLMYVHLFMKEVKMKGICATKE